MDFAAPPTAVALPVQTLKSAALAHFSALEQPLRALAERYRAVAFDLTTAKGMEAAKKARNDLRENGRYAVQRAEKALKDEVNDLKRVVAPKVESLIAIVQPIEDSVDGQIKAREEQLAAERAAREQKERARVAGHEARLAQLQGYPAQAAGKTAAQIASGILAVEAIVIDAAVWEEFAERAELAKLASLATLVTLHDKARAAEELAAEQARQRAENARVAAELAAERARLAADEAQG